LAATFSTPLVQGSPAEFVCKKPIAGSKFTVPSFHREEQQLFSANGINAAVINSN
jgi:hypothetical protein